MRPKNPLLKDVCMLAFRHNRGRFNDVLGELGILFSNHIAARLPRGDYRDDEYVA